MNNASNNNVYSKKNLLNRTASFPKTGSSNYFRMRSNRNLKRASFFRFCLLFFLPIFFLSCAGTQVLTKKEKKSLHELISASPIFSKNYTGFALFDPVAKETLYEFDSDNYFTPASNTKLFTLYTALSVLGDTIPAFEYGIKGDSLIVYGTGDPSLLHPYDMVLVGLGTIIYTITR